MRNKLLTIFLGTAATVAIMPSAQAATLYQVTSGVTSLNVDTAALDLLSGLGLTFSNSFETVTPAEGFIFGFEILPPTEDSSVVGTDFTFTIDEATRAFAPVGGQIEHTGGLSFEVDSFDPVTNPGGLALFSPLEIGDFSIGFDGGFFIADNITTGLPLFDLVVNAAPSFSDRTLLVSNVDVLVSEEFNDVLENASGNFELNLTGARIGSAQIDAEAAKVPEPGTALALVSVAGALFTVRRLAVRRRPLA
ncbi:MAG: PEP-CTERM sorting domain-containing protein [Leptolyngbyaceae cyanobacterium SM1_4_3]|nr:PEP-CTERM sorting domain-containing protein [Leptolyngbyaceae cyanobacterium SM1_4_3]